MQITIYTDGACDIHAANQPGGWAAILQAKDESGNIIKETVISGGAEKTTNNQMELTAVIEGLKLLTRIAAPTIFTDSRYVIDIATKKKKAIKNKSLWKEFFQIASGHYIAWKYVAGHSGHELNERCDRLAVKEKLKRAKPRANESDDVNALMYGAAAIYLSTRYRSKIKATSWAGIIVEDSKARELGGLLEKTSELEGTLIGAINCLENLPPDRDAVLFTAQEYLSKGMNQWLAGWVAKGWKTRGGEAVKYREHWERLKQLTNGRRVDFRFVKSREGQPHFERGKALTAGILKRA